MGTIEGNAHIFYNSVTEIASILSKLKALVDKETGKNLFNPDLLELYVQNQIQTKNI